MEAFVYLLVFDDQEKYIGKKVFYTIRRTKVPGKVRRKIVKKESNWREYLSSSEVVAEKLASGGKLVRREILHLCETRGEATYLEAKEMFCRSVLSDVVYLNKNILAKFFRGYGQ